jgi:hypothetical protein
MNAPTDADNYLLVAESLLEEIDGTEEQVAEWEAMENSRVRAAVSRAYYAVFLRIKYRLIRLRGEWRADPSRFPSTDVHSLLTRALRSVPACRPVADDLRHLIDSRVQADYEWHTPLPRSLAVGEVRLARTLMSQLGRMNDFDWKRIADRVAEAG